MIEHSDERVREMRQLSEKGISARRIARRFGVSEATVRRWLSCGAPARKREEGAGGYVGGEPKEVTGGITREEIGEVRRRTYVGSGIIIMTQKSCDPDASKGNLTGVPRMAIVVDVSHRDFCMVRLQSGTLESVLWSDLVMQDRKNVEGKHIWERKS